MSYSFGDDLIIDVGQEDNLKSTQLLFVDINKLVNKKIISLKNDTIPNKNNYVYISEEYASRYNLNKDDVIRIKQDGGTYFDFGISDIYKVNKESYVSGIIFDIGYLKNNDGFLYASYLENMEIRLLKDIPIKERIEYNEELIEKLKYFDDSYYLVCPSYDGYSLIQMYTNIFFYVCLFINIIVIALAIMVLCSSISVLLNMSIRKFGLFKSLGMKNKDVIMIIFIEIFIIAIAGLVISIIAFYSMNNLIEYIFKEIFDVLFPSANEIYTTSFQVSFINDFYLPLLIVIFILIFIFIASFVVIRKILYSNPILLIRRDE